MQRNRVFIVPTPWRTMPHLLASLFLHHEPAPIDYNRAMVALTESRLICSDLLRAHPRERGTILATKAEPIVPSLFPQQTATDTQCLQGESLCFTASLHPTHQSNQQYSILSLSDSSGAVVERISYTAYGQPTFTNATGTTLSSSAKATRYSYTGREWDPSLQLHYFRARWMSGVSGRFIGRDPIGYLGSTWNIYGYLSSRAIIEVDPMGLHNFPLDRTGPSCRQSSSSVTELVCEYDSIGYFGGRYTKEVKHPYRPGMNPMSTCLSGTPNGWGFVGYSYQQTTTTWRYCATGGISTTMCKPSISPMDAIVTVVATSILISVPVPLIEVKDIEFPDIDIGIGRDPRPVDKPERLPRPSEDPPFPPADKKKSDCPKCICERRDALERKEVGSGDNSCKYACENSTRGYYDLCYCGN